MTTREVTIDGGSPWGFRINGGSDLQQPIRISRVNPGSKAANRGIREGDIITSINGESTKDKTNSETHSMLKSAGDVLKLGLNEEGVSPKKRQYRTVQQQETHSSETTKRTNSTIHVITTTKKEIHHGNNNNSFERNIEENSKTNGGSHNLQGQDCFSEKSTISSNYSSPASTPSTLTDTQGSTMPDTSKSRKRRRNNGNKKKCIDKTVNETSKEENYRVESPKTIQNVKKKGQVVKSKSLDDDESLKIQEISTESFKETNETTNDKSNNVIIDDLEDSTIHTLTTETLKTNSTETKFISPEDESKLRCFLEGLNLPSTPEEAQIVKEKESSESIRAKRSKTRTELAQYFLPVYQNPRFLDVISEENSDHSDRETKDAKESKKPRLQKYIPTQNLDHKKVETILLEREEVELPIISDTCTISVTEKSLGGVEVVFLDDFEDSQSEDELEIPSCQLTPPPTPDCDSPEPIQPIEKTCCLTPKPSRSPSYDREDSSSRGTSLCTTICSNLPKTLRELCLDKLVSLPFGEDVLEELAHVSMSLQELTNKKPNEKNIINKKSNFGIAEKKAMPEEKLEDKDTERCYYSDTETLKTLKSNGESRLLALIHNITPIKPAENPRLQATNLNEWLSLAQKSPLNTQNNQDFRRRRSLPNEIYIQQMQNIIQKEKEIQQELEKLEEEKRKLQNEMETPKYSFKFDPSKYHISKNEDIAILNEELKRPKLKLTQPSTENFRNQMYNEYLQQIAERKERKHQKVIKISSHHDLPEEEIHQPAGIKDEFMSKLKQKRYCYQGDDVNDNYDDDNNENFDENHNEDKSITVIDGKKVGDSKYLPKHLKEFVDITREASENLENLEKLEDGRGIWTPGQRDSFSAEDLQRQSSLDQDRNEEPIAPVWTPKSAGSSPQLERKEFRPITFNSPVLSRKNQPISPIQTSSQIEPPWKNNINQTLSSSLQKRIPNSHSAPSSGFGEFTQTPRLPRAQNPTIILLQKAREGQLPKGASYIEEPPPPPRKHESPPKINPGEIVYEIKNEYTSESESERPKRIADLGPRKFPGIGPTTKDGMPLTLRSEVRDQNQSRWYKKMYDTIHKQKPRYDDDYVTIRYKHRRGRYPYTSGYVSEPEPGAYDSDSGFYHPNTSTLDRRRQDHPDDTFIATYTMPRTMGHSYSLQSDVIKHGKDVYKNQPGRIENYIPGHSSISEKEAKEWWDEVMDIFDGHLEQQKHIPSKGYMSQALKESGYESDSTLVFRRREDALNQLSPSQQREAYRTIQKGGDVPLHGLRKAAPERPKEIEYVPISPTLTKIRIHKSSNENLFKTYKRSAPSCISNLPPIPPSPPKRKSSRNNSTLRLISTLRVDKPKESGKRHETCFISNTNLNKNNNVKYLRDKITCKLTPSLKKKGETKIKVTKTICTSPNVETKHSTLKSKIKSNLNEQKVKKNKNLLKSKSLSSLDKRLSKSPELLSPNEVKKADAIQKQRIKKNDLPIKVTISERGKEILKTRKSCVSPTPSKKSSSSMESLKSTKKVPVKNVKLKKTTVTTPQKLKKSKKDELNGEISKQVNKKSQITLEDIKNQKKCVETNSFFQNLFLKNQPIQKSETFTNTSSWIVEKTKALQRRRSNVSEPSIGALKIYLNNRKPVSDSKFKQIDSIRSRSTSPKSVRFENFDSNKSFYKERSVSLPPKIFVPKLNPPETIYFSQTKTSPYSSNQSLKSEIRKSYKTIHQKKLPRSRSADDKSYDLNQNLTSSIESICSKREYQDYVKDLIQSKRKSERFKELNKFYSTIERLGELEKTTLSSSDLRPRRKFEDEIIDYDRWKEVRLREKTEREINNIYKELKDVQKERDLLFLPKDVNKWKNYYDSGLRIKEKSVDNIKENFEKLNFNESNKINKINKNESDLLTRGVGSRIWSSLSMEQVNTLKNQLKEIYQNGQPTKSIKPENYVDVPKKININPNLTVRRNSESSPKIDKDSKSLTEIDKKNLSKSLSKEILNRQKNKLVLAKETFGATVSAPPPSPRTCYSIETSEKDEDVFIVVPKKALIKTNAIDEIIKKPSSNSETESTDDSTRTVLCLDTKAVKEKVEYFEHVHEKDEFTPTIYKPAESFEPKNLSRSCQDFKELFGESESAKSMNKSRNVSPNPELYYLSLAKSGDVKKLKTKFDLIRRCNSDSEVHKSFKEIIVPGLKLGEVDNLRRKYEYPHLAGRGRSRIRRGGVISPIFLKAEDRYMPHINIISKIASLYPKKIKDDQKSIEELAEILGISVGEVEKVKQKFNSPDRMSLLGHMFTSSPNLNELKDIAPYLTASWTAHKFPRKEDNDLLLSNLDQKPKSSGSSISPSRYCNKSWWMESPTKSTSVTFFEEPDVPIPPPKTSRRKVEYQESPRKYVENEVTIHYKTPVRQEVKESVSEDELQRRQAEHMKKVYQEERRRKYLQVSQSLDDIDELQDMNNRRHTDNFIPSQKSPIPLNRYDDFIDDYSPKLKPRPKSPEPRLVAKALYTFVGQTARELTFKKGDIIYIRRQIDKNWYEGEHNAMVGLFPANYVEIIPYDGSKSTIRKSHEGQARAKYNFIAQTHLELSLAKGELVVITRRVDDNWFEGKIGGRKGIFPVSYVEVLIDPSEAPQVPAQSKPVAAPAAHSLLLNGSLGGKESMGSHNYVPTTQNTQQNGHQNGGLTYHAKPVQITGSLKRNPLNQELHVDTQSEPYVPYRALYKYKPQNEDEIELNEGDTVYVLEKCDDGWFVGASDRTGALGTFPGNYVERI
ncbi:uncharacterized protein CA isoform X5 [Onthophagus taurus]|uniref:uncharacterized protein CA isoform X5 n=1 Tax=Onthophagus taurus TaxID=166361 RepID=UPI0039BE2F35